MASLKSWNNYSSWKTGSIGNGLGKIQKHLQGSENRLRKGKPKEISY